jgi:zinc transporter 1
MSVTDKMIYQVLGGQENKSQEITFQEDTFEEDNFTSDTNMNHNNNSSNNKKEIIMVYHIDHEDDSTFNKSPKATLHESDKLLGTKETTLFHKYDECEISRIDKDHAHDSKIKVKHHDHYDILIGNRLHYFHDGHCDDHGRIDIGLLNKNLTEEKNTKSSGLSRLMKRKKILSKSWRFVFMGIMTIGFFFVELIFGIAIESLALQADAFHMLSDLVAIVMALYAVIISEKKETDRATFGMTRSEIVAGLINSIFLLSSCFFITIEVVQRFINFRSQHIDFEQINILIIIGSVGLGINIIGMFIFCSAENHHHHGHSHGHGHGHNHHEHNHSKKNKNIHALFLHVMGDALGSVGVIASGLIIKYFESEYRYLSDPAISVFIIILIIMSTIPLIRDCINILMHKVPSHINLSKIREDIYKLNGLQDVHHLHVWQLNDTKIVATLHIKIDNFVNIDKAVADIEKIFHSVGVHSTTIQVETVMYDSDKDETKNNNNIEKPRCINIVCDDKRCKTDVCCNNEQHTS